MAIYDISLIVNMNDTFDEDKIGGYVNAVLSSQEYVSGTFNVLVRKYGDYKNFLSDNLEEIKYNHHVGLLFEKVSWHYNTKDILKELNKCNTRKEMYFKLVEFIKKIDEYTFTDFE